jgi:FKBP-type peptidyl-prolyl cis-trans isomerase SlyD
LRSSQPHFARARPALTLVAVAALGLAPLSAAGADEDKEKALVVENGRTISIEYTLKLDDGSTADTNVGGDPLRYVQGEGQILPALENALDGLSVDDSREVTLPPSEGYGEVDPARRQNVDPEQIPEDARQVGAQLIAVDGEGQRVPVRVHEVQEGAIVLDLNHPLAGETLHFDVKVVGIE